MKISKLLTLGIAVTMAFACNTGNTDTSKAAASAADIVSSKGQSEVADNESQKDIVKVAVASKNHSTLVKALQAADLVNSLSNAGPFTVFAPTNAAFDKLPAGTLDELLKEEKKPDLQNILQYHVSVGVFKPEMLQDGQTIGQVNGDNITISKKGEKIVVNGTTNVIGVVPATNGIIYIVDAVLLPKK